MYRSTTTVAILCFFAAGLASANASTLPLPSDYIDPTRTETGDSCQCVQTTDESHGLCATKTGRSAATAFPGMTASLDAAAHGGSQF